MYPVELWERKIGFAVPFKRLAIFELIAVPFLIMGQLWSGGVAEYWPIVFASAIVLAGWIARKESCAELGIIEARFVIIPGIILAGKFLMVSFAFDHDGFRGIFWGLVGYFGWAWLQQLLLNGFFVKRCREAGLGVALTACLAGLVSAMVHLPNPLLTPVAAVGGGAASYWFIRMRQKNLYLLALCHAVIAIALLHGTPVSWHHHFTVGSAFWRIR